MVNFAKCCGHVQRSIEHDGIYSFNVNGTCEATALPTGLPTGLPYAVKQTGLPYVL